MYADADGAGHAFHPMFVEHCGSFCAEELLLHPLMLRAELNEQQLGNPDVALQCYERILIDYPASLYVDKARKRYNALKVK